MLYEKAGDQIAHVKFTVLLQSGGTTKITGLPLPTGFDVRYCVLLGGCVCVCMDKYMCWCMHECVCVCVCVRCLYKWGCMHVCGWVDVSVYLNMVDTCIQVCVRISEHLYVCAHMLTFQLLHTHYKCTYLHLSVPTFLHMYRHRVWRYRKSWSPCWPKKDQRRKLDRRKRRRQPWLPELRMLETHGIRYNTGS